jgi:hypothetical protein
MEENIDILPQTLEEAIDLLKSFYAENISEIKTMSEKDFVCSSHFMAGMFIRNSWNLWWNKDWDEPQPELNKWFESIDIIHADDMSAIILTCFYRNLIGLDYKIKEQVKRYKKHWKEMGFKNGIPRRD